MNLSEEKIKRQLRLGEDSHGEFDDPLMWTIISEMVLDYGGKR